MRKPNFNQKGRLRGMETVEGETLEMKVQRMLTNKESITDGAPAIYTERKEGVLPGHNIRTDRFDLALETTEKIQKDRISRRESGKVVRLDGTEDGKTEPIQATQQSTSKQ